MEIRRLNKDDLRIISNIHLSCFPGTMISSLGKELIEKYYGMFLHPKHGGECYCVIAEGEIVGFCIALREVNDYFSIIECFEQNNRTNLIKKVIMGLLKGNKTVYKKVYEYINGKLCQSISINKDNRVLPCGFASLVSIAVLPQWRKRGIGALLVSRMEDELKRNGIYVWELGVAADNEKAIDFYTRIGMKKIDTSNSHVFTYRKIIADD